MLHVARSGSSSSCSIGFALALPAGRDCTATMEKYGAAQGENIGRWQARSRAEPILWRAIYMLADDGPGYV